ncbi:MAG: PEP/pyruvate-binding domain-containing protein [Acidobacteriota bacterium]|nr:PEP/pyruvate-binding domain-containing protein [Acidobacteriota bacterium]MDH3523936.1 PEP/pyruvate-binding domain-containing protein [Acidobacteriota bacterium]
MRSALESALPRFDRHFFTSERSISRIGDGEYGGKANGLLFARGVLDGLAASWDPSIEVTVPRMAVLATSMFDAFMARNAGLGDLSLSQAPDDRIAHAFQRADLPVEMLGDLKALMDGAHAPLAIRSSSLLEDALYQPFAGVYRTKMIPNNQPERDARLRRLLEAVKFVYASTFFAAAKSYVRATDRTTADEKMAVIVQEIVGRRHGDRYYPDLSAVARSFNFYPCGPARADEGVVSLALGLGKTIVDGGIAWSYSPAHPRVPPPYSVAELLRNTQTSFWAVNMGRPPEYNPIVETEYLVEATLRDAEGDGSLALLASTYEAAADRLIPGIAAPGPRVLDFAPLLVDDALPLNAAVRALLDACEKALGGPVEVELAVTLDAAARRARLGFLQVRPMVVSDELVEIGDDELAAPNLLLASRAVMGNGLDESIADVVYVKPEAFEARATRTIGQEIAERNTALLEEGRPYALIGFGRWGSSDAWLGIPVQWGQICGARVIVEATLPTMNPEASQGAHFFHNISSFAVPYLTVPHEATPGIDWAWLNAQDAVAESDYVRHVRLAQPLLVKVDGRNRRGGVWRAP